MAQETAADLAREQEELKAFETELLLLQNQRAELITPAAPASGALAGYREIPLPPAKKDIYLDLFGIGWAPYYQVMVNNQVVELPGFKT
ncbi:MAG: hypothetical protein AB9891_07885 [Anaerolineaceae bacterium]